MENKTTKNANIGVLYVLLSALFFAASSSFGKIITRNSELSGAMSSFSRFTVGTMIMFVYMVATKKSFKANKMKHIVFRAVSNSISILLFSIGFQFTTITNVNMLQMTYPVFVMILAPLLYKEKIAKKSYFYLVLVMLGCYLVAYPKFDNLNIGDVLGFLSAIAGAFSVLSLKNARKYDDTYIIIFYVFLIAMAINFPFALRDFPKLTADPFIIFNILMSGLAGFLGQIFITEGYKYVDNATGAMVSTSRIVIAAVMGYFIFNDPINLRIVIGGIIVIFALIGASGYFGRKRAAKNK
ncbi:DMT family transporter [Peptoniphilus catoniae]|uniref:DMT family transporter n=1 Tax=Peptoniphilus catoniae TaxID=1660341 RepID=UPI0010FDF629|nr:DMT family transporter [Peptoniphilus catoniae]